MDTSFRGYDDLYMHTPSTNSRLAIFARLRPKGGHAVG